MTLHCGLQASSFPYRGSQSRQPSAWPSAKYRAKRQGNGHSTRDRVAVTIPAMP
ncbi:MAG: hypothetical protein QGF56_00805 [Verrucomicrobiota bacterium]|nr:hypothetical protein [Verrucomicrobiota bacterium]MDP6752197.1 hypothetical protein [Verrucomicrobiota bacterium]MDP7013789.1 hypothetical protein [Verrucomicrobiota bacterium]